MSTYFIQENTLMVSLALPVIAGVGRYRQADRPARIFFYLCLFSLFIEGLAYYDTVVYHSNLAAYNIGSLVGIFLVCLYFNYAIGNWRKNNTGYIIGAVSVIVGILNMCFFQSLYQITSYFLIYQGVLTMLMSLLLVKDILRQGGSTIVIRNIHFWLAVILFWGSGLPFLFYIAMDFYATQLKIDPALIFWAIYLINIAAAIASAAVFLINPKMQQDV